MLKIGEILPFGGQYHPKLFSKKIPFLEDLILNKVFGENLKSPNLSLSVEGDLSYFLWEWEWTHREENIGKLNNWNVKYPPIRVCSEKCILRTLTY